MTLDLYSLEALIVFSSNFINNIVQLGSLLNTGRYISNVYRTIWAAHGMTTVHGFIPADMCKIFRYGIFLCHSANSFRKCPIVGICLLRQMSLKRGKSWKYLNVSIFYDHCEGQWNSDIYTIYGEARCFSKTFSSCCLWSWAVLHIFIQFFV